MWLLAGFLMGRWTEGFSALMQLTDLSTLSNGLLHRATHNVAANWEKPERKRTRENSQVYNWIFKWHSVIFTRSIPRAQSHPIKRCEMQKAGITGSCFGSCSPPWLCYSVLKFTPGSLFPNHYYGFCLLDFINSPIQEIHKDLLISLVLL